MRGWQFLALSACGFTAHGGGDDVPTDDVTIVDDTLADFGGGHLVDGVYNPNGTIEPDGFVLGGLHARAYQDTYVQTGDTYDTALAKATGTPTGVDYAQAPHGWGQNRPKNLGLKSDDNFTVFYDGEILLPKGAVTIEADIDDRGVLQLALDPDAPTTFGPVLVAAAGGSIDQLDVMVPAAGWYPIRMAVTEDTQVSRANLTIVQGQVRTPVDENRLRARVTNAQGLLAFVFDSPGFLNEKGHVALSTIDQGFGINSPPYDATASFDNFTLRFAGQLKIDSAGSYTFTADDGIDGDDGWRVWIDGKVVAQHWVGNEVPSGAATLDPGYHDIVVDYGDNIGNAEIHVTMNGALIPADKLRPVVRRGNTFASTTTAATTIADHMATQIILPPLGGDAYTLIDAVDVAFQIDNQDMSTLNIDLFDCNGVKPLAVNTFPSLHYYGADPSCSGKTTKPTSPWSVRINDSAAGNGLFIGLGQVRNYGLAALYHGGPKMPFAPMVQYTSSVRPTPNAQRITSVKASGNFDGATVEVAVRTADDMATLEAAPWEALDEGEVFMGHELAQYRVTITSNGWQYPILDKVELTYTAP